MSREYWLAIFCRYGGALDAFASQGQEFVTQLLPEEHRERMAIVPKQELEHAHRQSQLAFDLCPELPSLNTTYTKSMYLIGKLHESGGPAWSAAWLTVGEKMFSASFRAVAHRAKQFGYKEVHDVLQEIALDEDGHVRLGLENIQILGVPPASTIRHVGACIDALNEADHTLSRLLPQGLDLQPFGKLGSLMAESVLSELGGS